MSPLDLLKKFVEEVRSPNYAPPIDFALPERKHDASFGGGDCAKHGRYYGHCHCCEDDFNRAQAKAQREFEWAKRDRLEALVRQAEALLK